MKMKLVLAAFLASTIMLNAQVKDRPHPQGEGKATPEMRADRMAEHLSLTDAEKAKVLELFKKEDAKMQAMKEEIRALRQKNEKISEEQKAKFEALRKTHEAELEKIIGKEKMAKLQAEREQQKQKMHQMAKRHAEMHRNMDKKMERPVQPMEGAKREKMKEMFSPENRANHLKQQLELTDDQKTALVELFTEQQKQMVAEQKQRMEELKKANDAEIEKIIGKEKMAKLNALRESGKEKAKEFRAKKEI